jgi:hypothetical protein
MKDSCQGAKSHESLQVAENKEKINFEKCHKHPLRNAILNI